MPRFALSCNQRKCRVTHRRHYITQGLRQVALKNEQNMRTLVFGFMSSSMCGSEKTLVVVVVVVVVVQMWQINKMQRSLTRFFNEPFICSASH